jgi:hypothetical protein
MFGRSTAVAVKVIKKKAKNNGIGDAFIIDFMVALYRSLFAKKSPLATASGRKIYQNFFSDPVTPICGVES